MSVDECVFCEKEAVGEAEVVDTEDGTHYILRLCVDCGKHFQLPGGTRINMAPLLPPIASKDLN